MLEENGFQSLTNLSLNFDSIFYLLNIGRVVQTLFLHV